MYSIPSIVKRFITLHFSAWYVYYIESLYSVRSNDGVHGKTNLPALRSCLQILSETPARAAWERVYIWYGHERIISPSSSSSKRRLIALNTFSCHSLRPLFPFYTSVMDLLVAQYSRPAFQEEGYSSQEQQELSETVPPLSLRFAMPPVAKVNLVGSYE